MVEHLRFERSISRLSAERTKPTVLMLDSGFRRILIRAHYVQYKSLLYTSAITRFSYFHKSSDYILPLLR